MVGRMLRAILLLAAMQVGTSFNASNVSIGLVVPLHVASGDELGEAYKKFLGVALMAVHHVNSRSQQLVPQAHELLPSNFRLAVDVKDSFSSPSISVGHAFQFNAEGMDLIVGSYRSAVSGPLSLAASVMQTPVISWASTSSSLSDKGVYSVLSRTVPSDAVLAVNILKIIKAFGWIELGVLAINDAYGSAFLEEVAVAAPALGLNILSQQRYNPAYEDEINRAVAATKAAGCRIILAIMFDADGASVLAAAAREGITGEGFIWLLADGIDPRQVAAHSTNFSLASQQMRGWFQFTIDPLMGEKRSAFQQTLLNEPLEHMAHPIYNITTEILEQVSPSPHTAFIYDAVWTAAIAASRTVVSEPTGIDKQQLLRNVRSVDFVGASGRVRLDHVTGDRLPYGLPVLVSNYNYELDNDRVGDVCVAVKSAWEWTEEGGLRRLSDDPPVWPGGVRGWELPPLPVACEAGNVFSQSLLRCEPCPPRTEEVDGQCLAYNASVGILTQVLDDTRRRLWAASGILAVRHVNSRSNALVPNATELLPPGFRIRVDVQDSKTSPATSIAHTIHWAQEGVDAIVGSVTSFVSGPVALAASIDGTPVTTWGATSSSLSDKAVYPLLSRTVPSDAELAGRVLRALRAFGWSRIGVIYRGDSFGGAFANDLALESGEAGIVIGASAKYVPEEDQSFDKAVQALKLAAVRVIVFIGLDQDTAPVVAAADKLGMIGEGYVWVKPDSFVAQHFIDAAADKELAMQQITGWMTVEMKSMVGEAEERFNSVLKAHAIEELQTSLVDITEEALNSGDCGSYCAFFYDAVWVTAIAASRTSRQDDGGLDQSQLLQNIRTTTFRGASGDVSFDHVTGDRDPAAMTVVISNLQPGESEKVQQNPVWFWTEREGLVRVIGDDYPPFWYADERSWEIPDDGSSCSVGFIFADDTLSCVACPPGYYQSDARCLPCLAGTVGPFAASTRCSPCEVGFAPRGGMTECDACPENSARTPSSPGTNITECRCLDGFFSELGSGHPCVTCPTGAVCDGGDSLPAPRTGFWGERQCEQYGGSLECPGWLSFVPCNPSESCEGGPEFACRRGMTGRNCAAAEAGWTVVGGIFLFECGTYGWLFTLLGMIGVVVVWFGINALASSEYVALNVALLFVQITALISSYGLKWHRNLENLNVALGVANFDVDFVTPSCFVDWGPVSAFYLQLLLPIFFGLSYATYFLIVATWNKWRNGEQQGEHEIRTRMWRGTLKNTVSICCIVYTTLALKCFSVYRCATFPDGHDYMFFAPDIRCWQGQHLGMVTLASIYIPCVLCGLPVLIFLVLRHHMRNGTLHTEEAMWQWSFIHSSYEADYKWWEVVLIARRCLIALITVAVDEPMLQAAATIAVLTALLAAHSFTRPYILASVDALDFAGLCGSILYVLGGLLMYPAVTAQAQGHLCDGSATGQEVFCNKDHDVKDAVSVVCLVAVSLTLLIAGGITAVNVREQQSSKQATKIIDRAFRQHHSTKQLMTTVNKVRLDEVLDGAMLLRWARQPVFGRTASDSASAYVRTEEQMNHVEVDLTDYSTEPVANIMRQLCEIEGLFDYLASDEARVHELLSFVNSMASYTSRHEQELQSNSRLRRFPLSAMAKFEFRPLLCYWIMATGSEDRIRFVYILEEVLQANAVEHAPLHDSHRASASDAAVEIGAGSTGGEAVIGAQVAVEAVFDLSESAQGTNSR